MPFDVVAWYESQAAASLTAMAAVSDRYYRTSGDDLYVKGRAPMLAGMIWGALTITTMRYAEFRQPSLTKPYRWNRHGDINAEDERFTQGFQNLWASPLPLYEGEKLNVYEQNSTTEVNLVAAWLSSGNCTRADQENVAPTHFLTGYADANATAGSWTDLDIETNGAWDQDLQEGRYAVIGMKVGSYKSSSPAFGVARLILQDSVWHPGVMVGYLSGDKLGLYYEPGDYDLGLRWPLMYDPNDIANSVTFTHDQLPSVEVCEAAANTDHIVELLLQKVE